MFEIRHAGVKGLGIFATKLIQPGTRILAERPVLRVRSERDVFAAARRLSKGQMQRLMELSTNPAQRSMVLTGVEAIWHALMSQDDTVQGRSTSSKIRPFWRSLLDYPALLNIFRNNNFELETQQQAVFGDICRINHACLPNSQGNFNNALGQFTIHAVKPIKDGEEITINYLPEHGALKEYRQGRLLQSYGFLCDCPACDTTRESGRQGEEQRLLFQAKLHAFAEATQERGLPDPETEFALTQESITLFENQGMAGREIATRCYAAAELAAKLGRENDVLRYAEKGLQMDKECLGVDNELFHQSVERCKRLIPQT
nr:set domain-containing protein 5 [Quercus suber]